MNSYHSYAQPAASSQGYGSNGYTNGYYPGLISSPPQTGHASSLTAPLMPMSGLPPSGHSSYASQPTPPYTQSHQQSMDTSGQIAPTGHKPKVTATLWEDEGTICFQVECDGLCVARRDDNQFINGTKLLNVAGMTRGRRDGILKSEKTRHVVKIGPMHLKGVWIPFDRALDFANREKITEKLYPLFVHNINHLLPSGQLQNRSTSLQSRPGKLGVGTHTSPLVSSMPQQHSMPLPSQIAGNQRPALDRAHTFHTPPTPTSASSVINHGADYWNSSSIGGGLSNNQSSVTLDNGIPNTRSLPSTPASTPPGASLQSIPGYHNQTTSSSMPQSSQYAPHYSSTGSYVKNEMAPPSRAGTIQNEHKDVKSDPYVNGSTGHESGNNDHHGTYQHDASHLGSNHSAFPYNGLSGINIMSNHGDSSDQVGSSTHHDAATGQITPRTSIGHDQWTGYQTPPRTNTYPSSTYPSSLVSNSNKRSRDDDEHDFKLHGDLDSLKRHKSGRDELLGSRPGIMQHAVR